MKQLELKAVAVGAAHSLRRKGQEARTTVSQVRSGDYQPSDGASRTERAVARATEAAYNAAGRLAERFPQIAAKAGIEAQRAAEFRGLGRMVVHLGGGATTCKQIGRYKVDDTPLGGGYFATTYRGIDPITGEEVALKQMRPGDEGVHVYQKEVGIYRQLERINSPHLIQLKDAFIDGNGSPVIVCTYAGVSLHQVRCDSPTAVEIGRSLLGGLAEIHARGLLHRDLRPENVCAERDPTTGRIRPESARIIDYNDVISLDQVYGSQRGGKPGWKPPERVADGPSTFDRSSDLFGIAGTLYTLVTGRPPFGGDTSDDFARPPDFADIEPALAIVLEKGLQIKRAKRFQSVEEFLQALDSVTVGQAAQR